MPNFFESAVVDIKKAGIWLFKNALPFLGNAANDINNVINSPLGKELAAVAGKNGVDIIHEIATISSAVIAASQSGGDAFNHAFADLVKDADAVQSVATLVKLLEEFGKGK